MADSRTFDVRTYDEDHQEDMYGQNNNQPIFPPRYDEPTQQTYHNLITTEQYFAGLSQQKPVNLPQPSPTVPPPTPQLDQIMSPDQSTNAPIKCEEEPRKTRGRKGVQYERQFTCEEKEMLIGMWHSRPILWDSALPEYLDTNKKQLAIKEISEAMNIEFNAIAKQMKSLKSYYGSLRQAYDAAIKNGATEVKKPTWPYYDLLRFLDENINRNASFNMKRNEKLIESHVSAKSAKRLSCQKQCALAESENDKDGACYSDGQDNSIPKDEDDIFGELIAKSMKKIDDCVEKEELKIEIQTCILQTKKQLIS